MIPGTGAGSRLRRAGGVLAAAVLVLAGEARAAASRCWIDKGALVAPAAFGDIAGDFLIDLSAPASGLHETRARSAGLTGDEVGGDLVLAGQRLGRVTLGVTNLDQRTRRFDTSINGVIGPDVLDGWILDLRFSPCRIRLLRPRAPLRAGPVRLPLNIAGGRPRVDALATDGVKVRRVRFAIDTADWESRIGGARLSRPLPADGDRPPIRLRAVEVGGRLFEQVPVEAETGESADALGMAVWSAWRMRLDLGRGVLDLWPDQTQ